MAIQSNARVVVALKRETTTGTPAGTSGGDILRITESPGFEPDRNAIESAEQRTDGTTSMGRLGGRSLTGTFSGECTIGGAHDVLLEAMMRGTWRAALVITEATAGLASITTTTNIITASAGSFITAGLRVGDVFRLTGHSSTANNNINLRVIAVTTQNLSVVGFGATAAAPLTANAVADTSFTITILKKLVNPAAPVRYSHTVEQGGTDMDLSAIFVGCRVTGYSISCRPNSMATFTVTFTGLNWTWLVAGTSPYFTAASVTSGLALVADDSAVRYNGTDVATFTGFDLDFTIGADADNVIGSTVAPDVADNNWKATGTITGFRQDFSNLTLWEAETEFEISITLQEPSATLPLPAFGIFLPRVKLRKVSAPAGGGTGNMVETMELMIGPKVATTGYDGTSAIIYSSAP
jgi:hypothetical protein